MSRTGTGKWKKIRAQARKDAQDQGLTNCPICQVRLDWNSAQKPRSVEVDHKIAVVNGGTDDPSNVWCICRLCNSRKDAVRGRRNQRISEPPPEPFVNSRW